MLSNIRSLRSWLVYQAYDGFYGQHEHHVMNLKRISKSEIRYMSQHFCSNGLLLVLGVSWKAFLEIRDTPIVKASDIS